MSLVSFCALTLYLLLFAKDDLKPSCDYGLLCSSLSFKSEPGKLFLYDLFVGSTDFLRFCSFLCPVLFSLSSCDFLNPVCIEGACSLWAGSGESIPIPFYVNSSGVCDEASAIYCEGFEIDSLKFWSFVRMKLLPSCKLAVVVTGRFGILKLLSAVSLP